MIPFSPEEFFQLFQRYNEAIWPVQIFAYALGAGSVATVFFSRRISSSAGLVILALLWVWTGIAYHWLLFSTINPVARMFAVLFVAEALLLLAAARSQKNVFVAYCGPASVAGWLTIAYATVIYPIINTLLGHPYPASPSFGVTPCPTVIFTFGMLLLSKQRVHWMLFVPPVVWSAIGGSAAFLLGVLPDVAMPVAAAVAVALNWRKGRASHGQSAPQ